jgi:hypothetical protein
LMMNTEGLNLPLTGTAIPANGRITGLPGYSWTAGISAFAASKLWDVLQTSRVKMDVSLLSVEGSTEKEGHMDASKNNKSIAVTFFIKCIIVILHLRCQEKNFMEIVRKINADFRAKSQSTQRETNSFEYFLRELSFPITASLRLCVRKLFVPAMPLLE